MQVIIFTDLDGSLLNHEDYSFAEATPSLDRIKRSGIPLIMTTSKTRREIEPLQREMGIGEPFIVENGGGIFFPHGYRNLLIGDGATEGWLHRCHYRNDLSEGPRISGKGQARDST